MSKEISGSDIAQEKLEQSEMAHLVGASFLTPKACGFDSQSEYIPRLWVTSLVRAHVGDNR